MFCTKCGAQMADDSAFCPKCGNAVASNAVQAAQPAAQQVVQQPYNQVGAVPTNPPVVRGCFGSGWDDVTNSEGWFKKIALMAVIDLVPIFNWVNAGYGWNWSKDLVQGKRESLPDKIVSSDNFKLGFFEFVLGLIMFVVLYAEGFVLGFVPVLGVLAAMVLGVFAGMFVNLSYVRTALFGKIGEGFAIGKLFDAYKRNLGTLFCITFVPGLISAGLGLVVGLIGLLVIGAIAGTDFLAVMSASARYGSYSHVPSALMYGMGGSFVAVVVVGFILAYIEMIIARFCQLVAQRATGHYIARNVPEWAGEVESAAQTVQPEAAVAPVPSTPQKVFNTPVQTDDKAVEFAAQAPVAVDADAGVTNVSASQAPQPESAVEPEPYGFAETSVLPEMPDEDLDTIVQPELRVSYEAASENAAPAFQPVPDQTAIADGDGAVRLQPTVASGPLMGDDSDTLVLMGESPAPIAQSQPAAGQRTIQLTRVNGDTCVLSTFPTTIGKGSEADLVIEGNGAISRVHARILRDGDVFAAEDLGSTNKTFIGSYELPANTPTILSDGDVLKLANETLQVKIV